MPRKPHVEVIERSVQSAAALDPRYNKRLQNPFGAPSADIKLKDTSREARWFNGAVGTDHIWRAKQNGWDQVRPEDVSDLDQLGGYAVTNGFVTRGERNQEVLMSMPRDVRAAVQQAKVTLNNRNLGNPNRQRNEIAEAAANRLGGEAADRIASGLIMPIGSVTDQYERIESREPVE